MVNGANVILCFTNQIFHALKINFETSAVHALDPLEMSDVILSLLHVHLIYTAMSEFCELPN